MSVKPLNMKNFLAPTPSGEPRYSVVIKNANNNDEKLGCPRVTRALVALMNQHAVIGGAAAHWGGPAAFAEINSSVHAIMFREKEWHKKYNYINDAGHCENGVYALRANLGFDNLTFDDLKKFRSIESKLTGHGEAHLNPEGVFISNGPLGSGAGQAQGLAIADKAIGNDRTTLLLISDGASMEGEAKESFAAIPGLAAKNKTNPFVMIVSDNNTKLSGRIDQDSFDMNPTFNSLSALGWEVEYVEEGHNLALVHSTIDKTIEAAKKDPTKARAIVFKTVKGFGVKATEESASGGHGYPLKAYDEKLPAFVDEIFHGETPSDFKSWCSEILDNKPAPSEASAGEVKKEKVQPGFARAAITAAKAGLPVYSVSADLQGSTGIKPFHGEFPEQSLDIGVAESNMISTAVGLSKQGLIPIVDTFAQFAVTKGNLPLIMAGLSGGPIIGLFSHAGFQDAADGASHQATTYIAATASIPHVTTVVCSCSSEAEALMTQAINDFKDKREKGETPNSTIFYYGRENHPAHFVENPDYTWGKVQTLTEGDAVTIIAAGPLLQKALEAADKLKENGVNARVLNNPFVNKIDVDGIKDALSKTDGKLITIEDHQLVGGMGANITQALKLADVDFKIKSLAIQGKFGQSAYKADQLYAQHSLAADDIVSAYKQL